MIATDTNILVYAHRKDSPFHIAAKTALGGLTAHAWYLPWPCAHEFINVVTNPRLFHDPTPFKLAFEQVEAWLTSGKALAINEGHSHLGTLQSLALAGRIAGGQIHDARIAAICLQHGVSELWTADRDFSRYPKLKTRNPLVG